MARNLISSDLAIRSIKQSDPRTRLSDGDGLFLLLSVNGGSHGWRFDYRFGGKRKMLSLGTYPDTSLALARRKADDARHLLAEGINPSDRRKAAKVANAGAREALEREAQGLPPTSSFEAVAREWYEVKNEGWAPKYAEKIIARLENDVFPWSDALRSMPSRRLNCSRYCGGSRVVASSRRRTALWRTAARSSGTRSRSARRPTIRRAT